jgi:carboxyl-terminal processing protease
VARIERLATLMAATVLVSSCTGGSAGKVDQSHEVRAYVDAAIKVLDRGLFAVGPSWRMERDRARNKMYAARRIPDTYGELDELAVRAGGTHSSFHSPAVVSKLKNGPYEVPTVTAADGIATLTIPGFVRVDSAAVRNYERAAGAAVRTDLSHATCGWIIDLRSNSGGNMWPMVAAASPFLSDGLIMSFRDENRKMDRVVVRGTTVSKSGQEMGTLDPAQIPKLAEKPVAVLQSQTTASASEGIIVAFAGQKNVRTFGQATLGLSSVNYSAALSDGAELVVTVSRLADRSGKTYAGRIDPRTPTVGEGNEIPSQAVSWLRSGCR